MADLNREFLVEKYRNDKLIHRTRINMSNYQIRKIDSNTFSGLTKLVRLDLSNNEIEKIEVKLFEDLLNLEELMLYSNKLKGIDSDTFKGLEKLKLLWLQLNEIKVLEFGLFENLSNLTELILLSNKLKKIDSNTFKGLDKLEELNLGKNEIEEIDSKSFERLSNLKGLNLSQNKLKSIDSNTFKGLTKLQWLNLGNNVIEKIDVKLIESLSCLKGLYLNNYKLKSIDSNTFKRFDKLEELDLSNNEIQVIDFRLFECLLNLKVLALYNNKLKGIDFNTFKKLTKLEWLYLNNNEIEEIDVRLFEALSSLKGLYLSNNKLKEIDRKCFEPLKSIEVIEIYDNVGLNALPFIIPSAYEYCYNNKKVKKYGSISRWNQFLQQFPQLEAKKEDSERQISEALDCLKIEEENERRAKLEEEHLIVTLSSIVLNLSATNKEIANEFQDPNIGLLVYDRYKIKEKLGKGSFGLVYLVDDTKTDLKRVQEKAMKIMKKMVSTVSEIELFSEICNENIVRYFDHFHMRIGNEDKTFLITEYCENGDLRKKIEAAKRSDRNFDERQILDWIRQTTNALKYLHSRKPDPIIHLDIKPENMLLNESNEIKLADLGWSKLMDNTQTRNPLYMSPELFRAQFNGTKFYPNSDIWSLGCVLYELIFLTDAFPEGQKNDPPIPSNISSSGIFSSILPKMLEKDCSVRIKSQRLFTELLNLYDD